MSWLIPLIALIGAIYLLAVIEGWSLGGAFSLARPARAALAMIGQESTKTRKSDALFYQAGPVLLLVAGVLAVAVIPLAPDIILADMATGALFLNAALAYVLVALIMAGWGPNGAYAMIGGWRFLGQFLGYAMLIVMPITAVAMRAESLMTTQIVTSQAGLWNVFYQPLGFVLFMIAAQALIFLPPLDLPVAPGELAGGVEAEYSGPQLLVFRLARFVIILALAGAATTFYFGGWLGPVLPDWVWSGLKTMIIAAAMLSVGRFLPRLREERFLALCWKLGIPLSLINILVVGVLVLVVPV